ncbi:MAG: signal peptidase II [Bacilli bacterium]|nr:signal peptidase II [Bacilli bacterium]MBR3049447.1 signal peptidase II [Bacilli bacterium]
MKNKEKVYSVAAILLIIDQFVKLLIKTKMKVLTEIKIIPNFFSIYYVKNKGAAFSILNGKTYIFIIVAILLLFLIDRYLKEEKFTKLSIISLGMIIGGIVGNLIDRLLYHSVIDYLSFNIFGYNFPVFNIADIGITVGCLLYIIELIRRSINESKSRSRKKDKNR